MVIGFGSLILHFTGYQFRIVSWAEDWQPGLGFAIGGVGILLCALASTLRRRNDEVAAPPAGQPYPPPMLQQQQQYSGQPTQQFPQPPREPFRQAPAPYP